MITETEEYKGSKFTCDNCGYIVSSDAMSDFDVEDFKYCPCCGEFIERDWKNDEFLEKLIERLDEYTVSHLYEHDSEECLHCKENEDEWCSCRNCHVCLMDKVKEIIKQLSEEYATDTNVHTNSSENLTGWIPCDERLPEYNPLSEYYESVIVTLDDGRVVDGCYRNKDKEWWVDATDGEHYSINATGHVIAWMPLPGPFKGE